MNFIENVLLILKVKSLSVFYVTAAWENAFE